MFNNITNLCLIVIFIFYIETLDCYYCESTLISNKDCNAEESGRIVKCQLNDTEGDHYGNVCAVAHTGNLERHIYFA